MTNNKSQRKIFFLPLTPLIYGLCLFSSAGYTTTALAYHQPLWELGIGAGALNAPYYRGSKKGDIYAIPFPYIIYRGDLVKVDRDEGIRARLFESERVRISLSVAGSVPVPDSNDNARANMPGLDPLVEFGPALSVRIWDDPNTHENLELKFPFRTALSVGNPIMEYQGLIASPYFNYAKKIGQNNALWSFNTSIGPIFASEGYHDYFYQVKPKYVTEERPEYHPKGGYSGSRITFTVSRTSRYWSLGLLARYDDLRGAEFADSPVVETKDYLLFGMAVSWIFTTSNTMVEH